MATAILTPLTGSSYQLINTAGSQPDLPVGVGDTDICKCLQTASDGKFARADNTGSSDTGFGFSLDLTNLPSGATINGVAIQIIHRSTAGPTQGFPVIYTAFHTIDIAVDTSGFAEYDEQIASGFTILNPSTPFETWNVASYTPGNINPLTGIIWTRADLAGLSVGLDNNQISTGPPGSLYDIDYFAFIVDYTGGGPALPCWYNALTNQWAASATSPGSDWQERACPLPTAQTTIDPVFGSTLGGD